MNVQINRSRFDPRGEREGRKAECPGQRNVGRVLERGLGDLEHECVLIPLTGPKPFKKKKRERERERDPERGRDPLQGLSGSRWEPNIPLPFIPVTRRGMGSLGPTLP